jgi:hypothetical protein
MIEVLLTYFNTSFLSRTNMDDDLVSLSNIMEDGHLFLRNDLVYLFCTFIFHIFTQKYIEEHLLRYSLKLMMTFTFETLHLKKYKKVCINVWATRTSQE